MTFFFIINRIVQGVTRMSSHLAFFGAVSIDWAGVEHLHAMAIGLYLLSFMIDHAEVKE